MAGWRVIISPRGDAGAPAKIAQRPDWLFFVWAVATLLASFLLVGAPRVVPLAAMLTRIRRSRWTVVTLWVIAGVATLVPLLPFLIIWLGLSSTSFVEM